ncbi:MAG: cytochrome c biogenesis protein CcsA [Chloroflexi bacterium]|nr:cytochrome c biogenesis protein CcsA [Chloroflexota bacterium]
MPPKPKMLQVLDIVSILLLAIATLMVFLYAPMERTMGMVQKVFYFHVSANWIGMLAFFVAAVAGGVYLAKGNRFWDVLEVAAVEIGLAFSLIGIITGSIWARPIWNTWWTWDPRLVTVTVMELIYVAYFMLRQGIEDPDRRARYAAVYAIVGFLSVPLTFLSIRLYRSIHPVVITSSSAQLSPKMFQTFMFSLFTFTVLFVDLLWHRVRLGELTERVERLRMKLSE